MIKKPFEETIEHLKKLRLINSQAAANGQATKPPSVKLIVALVVLLAAIEFFLFPDWLEVWMFILVIITWGLFYSYKNSKANREAGE